MSEEITVKVVSGIGKDSTTTIIEQFSSYSFTSDFFKPTDDFILTLEDERAEKIFNKIQTGDEIQLYINGSVQATGYIDDLDILNNRSVGTKLTIRGRDRLGYFSDSIQNPSIELQPDMSYKTAFETIFNLFGFKNIKIAENDEGFEASLASGGKQGKAKKDKKKRKRDLTDFIKNQIKPRPEEGYMEYILRLCKRNGWFVNLSPDGKTVTIFPPTYERDNDLKVQKLVNNLTGLNNVINWNNKISFKEQPSVIVMQGSGGGGNYRKNISSVIMLNDITAYDDNDKPVNGDEGSADLLKLIEDVKKTKTKVVDLNTKLRQVVPKTINLTNNAKRNPTRALFLKDSQSNDIEDMQFYIEKMMHDLQNKFWSLDVVVDGHTNNGIIWTPNTMVEVVSDRFNINNLFWLQSRTFTKNRVGGTTTSLNLRLPYIY